MKSEWISVNDYLPDYEDNSVLVHFSNGSVETVHLEFFTDVTCGVNEKGEQMYCKMFENWNPEFTHWMPLPEPPEDF